jgi:predicted ester cyclase
MASEAERNKAVVRRYYEEAFNRGNLSVVEELLAPGFVSHNAPGPGTTPDRAGSRQTIERILASHTGYELRIEDMVAEGDRVATRFTTRGAHISGKEVTTPTIVIHRLEDGQIVESWAQADMLGVLRQMGLLPPAAEAR